MTIMQRALSVRSKLIATLKSESWFAGAAVDLKEASRGFEYVVRVRVTRKAKVFPERIDGIKIEVKEV